MAWVGWNVQCIVDEPLGLLLRREQNFATGSRATEGLEGAGGEGSGLAGRDAARDDES